MPSLSGTPVARTRANLAVAHRRGDPEQITERRREHAEAKLAAYIARVVDEAPPLSAEQRDRLAVLLRGGGQG